jgi:DNA-binding MltR family transcriptional regulator
MSSASAGPPLLSSIYGMAMWDKGERNVPEDDNAPPVHRVTLNLHFDPDIESMTETVPQKTMVQMYRNFQRGSGKLFSAEIDAENHTFYDLRKVSQLLESEDAKVLPIIFCAYIDDVLIEMYRREIPADVPGGKSSLLGTVGPFSTLSSRIKLAYCFQLIAPDLVRDIDVIRKVRNDLSHNWDTSIRKRYFSVAPVTRMSYIENLLQDHELYERLSDLGKLRLRLIWIAARTTYESKYYHRAVKQRLDPIRTLYTKTPPKLLGQITQVAWESSQRLAATRLSEIARDNE